MEPSWSGGEPKTQIGFSPGLGTGASAGEGRLTKDAHDGHRREEHKLFGNACFADTLKDKRATSLLELVGCAHFTSKNDV